MKNIIILLSTVLDALYNVIWMRFEVKCHVSSQSSQRLMCLSPVVSSPLFIAQIYSSLAGHMLIVIWLIITALQPQHRILNSIYLFTKLTLRFFCRIIRNSCNEVCWFEKVFVSCIYISIFNLNFCWISNYIITVC